MLTIHTELTLHTEPRARVMVLCAADHSRSYLMSVLAGRDHLTIFRSIDEGQTYQEQTLVDPGAAGYSALQVTFAAACTFDFSATLGGAGGHLMVAALLTPPQLTGTVARLPQAYMADGSAASPGTAGEPSLWLLYEQSDRQAESLSHMSVAAFIGALSVLDPDRFVLRAVNDVEA
jgi:hypothetical protein